MTEVLTDDMGSVTGVRARTKDGDEEVYEADAIIFAVSISGAWAALCLLLYVGCSKRVYLLHRSHTTVQACRSWLLRPRCWHPGKR